MDGLKARLSFDAVAYDYDDEYLTIDTDTHTININNVSRLFGVQYDGNSKLIKFRIRNKLSDIQKMQDSIVYINWIDSRGVKGQSIAINKTINNDTCEFSWKVPFDALKNSGVLHFAVSAVVTKNSSSVIDQRWSTKIASVITPDGIYIKSYTPSSEEEDRIAQIYTELSNMINKQNDNLQSQVNSVKEDLVNYGIGLNALPDRSGTYNDNGITYIVQDDNHTISVNGTATAGSHFSYSQTDVPTWITKGKRYIAKVINGNKNVVFVVYAYIDNSWKLLASTYSDEQGFIVPENTTKLWIRLDVAQDKTVSAMITPVIADTYTLYKIQEDVAKLQNDTKKLQDDTTKQQNSLEYLEQTNSSFDFVKFTMGFIDYYGNESASTIRAVSDYISGKGIFKIHNPHNVPTTWHFYDENKKHIGATKSDYPTKEIIYLDMTDYAYFRLVTKEDNNPTKSNAISCNKINPTDEVKQIQNVSSVAHQGYSVTERYYGDSRLSSFRGAKNAGFSDAETDIVWTSDGIPVCCHDKTFVDSSTGETITISAHTLSELKEYNYYGEKICSFEEILNECKKLGLVLHIDHANEFIEESKFTILFNIVKKYQMQNYVWWASAHETHIRMMLNIFPYANISRAIDKEWLDANLVSLEKIHGEFPNAKLCIDQNYTEFSTDYTLDSLLAKIPSYLGLTIWNVDDINEYAKYFPYTSAMSSNKISYPIYAMRKIYCETN